MDRPPCLSVGEIRGRSIVCHLKVATSSRATVKSVETEWEEPTPSLETVPYGQKIETVVETVGYPTLALWRRRANHRALYSSG
jgi:hypothetical protein